MPAVVRAFDNDDVVHVEDSVDPVRDLSVIQVGMIKQYKEICNAPCIIES
jgi:ribosome-binding ATPase YchF (GTP1/OBG family)